MSIGKINLNHKIKARMRSVVDRVVKAEAERAESAPEQQKQCVPYEPLHWYSSLLDSDPWMDTEGRNLGQVRPCTQCCNPKAEFLLEYRHHRDGGVQGLSWFVDPWVDDEGGPNDGQVGKGSTCSCNTMADGPGGTADPVNATSCHI